MNRTFYRTALCILLSGLLSACSAGSQSAAWQDVTLEAEPITSLPGEKDSELSQLPAEKDSEPSQLPASEQASETASWYGSWEIKDYQTCDIYALSQEEIERYLTYTLSYYADSCFENGTPVDICMPPQRMTFLPI